VNRLGGEGFSELLADSPDKEYMLPFIKDSIFHTAGSIGRKLYASIWLIGADSLDESDGADGDQV